MTRRFVLLDRDGTIIPERHYLADESQVELLPGVAGALRRLQQMGLGLVVLTNQSGIGRGLFDDARVQAIHRRLADLLAAAGVLLDGIYYCPHTPTDNCRCRKPETGLVELAAKELHFDPHTSFVVGDKPCDITLGQRIRATTFLVRTGYGQETASSNTTTPGFVIDGLGDVPSIMGTLWAETDERLRIGGTHC